MPFSCRLALAQLDAADLAARRLGQLADELYPARVFVRGRVRLAVVLDLHRQLFRWLVVLANDDVRFDDAAPVLVGCRHNGALDDRRVLDEDALDLEGPYTVTGGEYDVVRAPHEPQISVRVPVCTVAGQVITVAEDRRCRVGLLPVLFEQRGDASEEGYVARLVRLTLVAFHVHDLHVAPGRRLAHGAGTHFEAWVVPDEQGVLGLPVAVVDCQSVKR